MTMSRDVTPTRHRVAVGVDREPPARAVGALERAEVAADTRRRLDREDGGDRARRDRAPQRAAAIDSRSVAQAHRARIERRVRPTPPREGRSSRRSGRPTTASAPLLSFGQDPRWRRFLVSRVPADGGHVLDVATGTGLVAELLLRAGHAVTGLDQSPEMLALARPRFGERVELVEASAEALPFADASFDHLTFTYLLRYVDDPGAVLRELARVVRPGGTIAMLEFGLPRGLWRPLWELYVRVGLPVGGRLVVEGLGRGRQLPRAVDPRLLGATPGAGPARPVARGWDRRRPRHAG